MKIYPKGLASCKLDEPAMVKICGMRTTLQEIAKVLNGNLNGEWINIRGPGHSSNDRSLGIKLDENARQGFIVNSLAGDDPNRSRAQVNLLLNQKGHLLTGFNSSAAGPITAKASDASRTFFALQIWSVSVPAIGTLVETYLKARGITVPIPSTIRFHPNLRHGSGAWLPAMVALVTRGQDDEPVGILRTFLAEDGKGKAKCSPDKMMLGRCGGGAVRLGDAGGSLMVGEGIETCLSVIQATGRPAWAALSTSGLRALDLPPHIQHVTVLADGDQPGERAAQYAASRWVQEGRRVGIAPPPQGLDFNDVLLGHARRDGAA
jgi:putative DNA primase/helicase